MGIVLAVAILIVVLGIIGYVTYKRFEKYLGWHQFRSEHGLSYTGFGVVMDFGLEGEYRGFPISVWVERTEDWDDQDVGVDDDDREWTVYELVLPECVPRDLAIYEENMLSGVAESLGAQDIEIGREIFDEYLTVKASDVEGARSYLGRPEVADAFLEFRNRFKGDFQIRDGVVRVEHYGMADAEAGGSDGEGVEVQSQMEAAFDGIGGESHHLGETLDAMVDYAEEIESLGGGSAADAGP